MLPVHRAGGILLGLLYATAAVLIALWGALVGEFHCYNQECPGADWTEAREAWQWDVIVALAFLGGLAGLITAVLAFSVRRLLIAQVGFFLHGALVCITGALLLYAHDLTAFHFVLWVLLVYASGGALFYVRASRQRAGTRFE